MRIGVRALLGFAVAAALLEVGLLAWPEFAPRISGGALLLGAGWAAARHLAAARRTHGHAREVWSVGAGGILLCLLSMLWFAPDEILANRVAAHPSLGDLPRGLAFGAAVAAMLLIPGVPRSAAGRLRMVLDGVLTAAAGFGLAWLLGLAELVRRPETDLADPLTLGYPVAAVVILSIALLLIAGDRRRRDTALTLFCAGIAAASCSVLVSAVTMLAGVRPDRTGGHGLLLFGFLLLGAATARPLPERHVESWDPSTGLARFLPYPPIALLAAGAAYVWLRTGEFDSVLVSTAGVLVVAVLARLLLTLRLNASLADALDAHRREADHRAHHDPLTGLANRTRLTERLDAAVAQLTSPGDPLEFTPGPALLLIDLDGFKAINDSLGHAAGDQVLTAVAERLRGYAGPRDTVARLGGDEFALLLNRVAGVAGATAAADELITLLSAPVTIPGTAAAAGLGTGLSSGLGPGLGLAAPGALPYGPGPREVTLRASIGAAVADVLHRDDADRLLRDADVALHAAKSDGRGRYRVSDAQLRAGAVDQIMLDTEMRSALARGEFEVHYQPIIELATGRVSGAEALVRWRHPRRGMVPPGSFLPTAEAAGLLPDIDRWVLREACRQATVWRRHVPHFSVSVNISAGHVTHSTLVSDVTGALAAAGLPAAALVLELTETALVADTTAAASVLAELAKLGVRVALDDFGTGYSSLTYLRTLPIHSIKIDRTFVWGLGDGATHDAVTRAIVDLAGTLGLVQVAEGVETDDQADWLRGLRCTYGQGFHFSHPVPAERMGQILGVATADPPARFQDVGRHHRPAARR